MSLKLGKTRVTQLIKSRWSSFFVCEPTIAKQNQCNFFFTLGPQLRIALGEKQCLITPRY